MKLKNRGIINRIFENAETIPLINKFETSI